MSFDRSTTVCADVTAAAQDTAAVNDDCCEVCLVAERDARIALVPCDTSVSVSRALTKCSIRDVDLPSVVLELTRYCDFTNVQLF